MPLVEPLFFALFGSDGFVPLVPDCGELVMPGSDGLCCAVCADAKPVASTKVAAARPVVSFRIVRFSIAAPNAQTTATIARCSRNYELREPRFCATNDKRHDASESSHGQRDMSDNGGGFRAHHKYMIAAIGVIAVLAFLYNLGIFDVWTVERVTK